MKKKIAKNFSPLGDIPKELILQITEEMATKDKLSLSSTCWNLRMLIGSEFFEKTVLQNSEKSGAMVRGLSSSKANELVKTLWYEGLAPTDKDKDGYADISMIMPNTVHSVLANLQKFPNLEKVSIGFDFGMDAQDKWGRCIICLPACTEVGEALASESGEAWHYLMAKTFEALIVNKKHGGIKNLQIRDLFPRDISTSWNNGWKELLKSVETFDLSLWGNSRGVHDRELSATTAYMKFIKDLDWVYFYRLTNVTDLTFSAHRNGMLIGQSLSSVLWEDLYLPLAGNQMRRLKKVTFKNIFLTIELIDFLVGHIATLESLTLNDCAAYIEADSKKRKGPSWSELLDTLSDARAPRMKQLSIQFPSLEEIQAVAGRAEDADMADLENGAKEACEELAKLVERKPVKHVFCYAHLDDQGKYVTSWKSTTEFYKKAEDQRAYERLAGLVSANAMEMPWRMERLSSKYGDSWTMNSSRPAALRTHSDRS